MAKERKWAAESQVRAVARVTAIEGKIRLANEQYGVLKKCGLEREARASILPKIQELERQKLQLIEETDRQRRRGARQLLVCFCAADLATEAADDFADTLHEISWGGVPDDNDFSALLRKVAQNMNSVVCTIDKGGSEPLSYFYADMAEECVTAAKKAVGEVIDKWMDTPKGRKYF